MINSRINRRSGLDQGEGTRDDTTSGLDADTDDSLLSADAEWYKERSGKERMFRGASETLIN